MPNNEAGAFLNITPDVLKKLDSFDEKLEQIQEHAHTAADALKNGFGKVVVDTTKLENAITSLASKISSLNTAGKAFDNIGDSAQQSSVRVEGMSSSISSMAQTLNQLKFSNFSIETFSPENVAKMREAVSQIKSQLKNNTSLSDSDKSALSKEKAMYEEKLKEYQSFINIKNKIAANANAEELRQQQSTYRKMTNVMESYMKKAEEQKQRYENAMKSMADYAAQSPAQRTSAINNTLSFSANAKTLQDDVAAIKLLKEARLQLDKTDKNYQATLNQINSAIAKHNQALTEAGVKSQQLATRHRNLMDTAGQLKRQLALVFSVSQIEGYISKLAKVRGEFELQQRSLQAILQNKSQADQIFNKTVQLAVKSPFQIKELVTYTKQLAAYRVESSKLYDTTKRLADVSAGLGVDMGRLILAYGQVKAAAYLRGTEVRQFTEAGINLYGELQRYFEEVKGEAYTTAQIVDMISKRKVTFEDIENIFKRLTDSGGLFYNMQEIQAETLQGKISNLKDSIDVMLNSIGKANEDTLKGSIDAVRVLIDNWEAVAVAVEALVSVMAVLKLQSVLTKKSTIEFVLANTQATIAMGKSATVAQLLKAAFVALNKGVRAAALAMKSFAVSNPYVAAITAVLSVVTSLIISHNEYIRKINEINKEYNDNVNKINNIVSAYNKLKKASDAAAKSQKDGSNIDIKSKEKRNEIQKLIDKYNAETGTEINIDVSSILDKDLDKKFNEIYARVNRFYIGLSDMKKAYIETDDEISLWGILGETISKDAEQLTKAEGELLRYASDYSEVLDNIGAHYDSLTPKLKEYYDEIAKGQNKAGGESQIEYMRRQYDFFQKVMYELGERNIYGGYIGWAQDFNKKIRGNFNWTNFFRVEDGKKVLMGASAEFDHELEKMKKSFDSKGLSKVEIAAILNTTGAEQNWSEWQIKMATDKFEVTLAINEEESAKNIDYVKKSLEEYYKEHPINIGFSMQTLDENPFEKWMGTFSENTKSLKQLEDIQSRLGKILELPEAERGEIALKSLSESIQELYREKGGKTYDTFINDDLVQFVKDYDILKKIVDDQVELLSKIDIAYGGTGKGSKGSKRDIWAERISVLKEMQSRYEKLNQLMGETRAIEETRSAFKGALDFTQMGEVIKAEDIIPTKQGMIDALEKLLKQIPNDVKNAAKRTGLEKEIAELKIGIQQDYLKEQLEKTKQNIEDMFNGLDLHQKLKDAGLSEAEVQQLFPGLAKTLDDVEKGIEDEFNKLRDVNGELGKDEQKDYEDRIAKLDQQRIKESQDLVIELTKAYKTQLSDQLQLDRWYYEEKAKIENANLTDEQKQQFKGNLKSQYDKKTDENTWKQFQNSDMYISMFENIESSSTRMLEAMRDKLASLRENLKNLPADQLKAIVNQMEDIDKRISQKNPFKGLTSDVKEYIGFLKQRKALEEENLRANSAVEALTKQRDTQSEIVQKKQQEFEKSVATTSTMNGTIRVMSTESKLLQEQVTQEKMKLSAILAQLEAEGKITKETAEQIRNGQKEEASWKAKVGEIGKYASEVSSALPQIAGDLENVFGTMDAGTKDTIESISEIAGGLGDVATGIANGNWVQAVGGVAKTIGSIFNIKDKKKEREIQRQIKNVEKLQKAYETLKEKMDEAWNSVTLHDTTKQTVTNIDQQIASYQKMINAEEAKKKTDRKRIEEWNGAIEELKKTKQEILDQEKMDLGGIGGESEYKSAAQAFADAWVDAFNESEDGLKALQETFDDYITNLIKKQAMMRLVQARMKSIFDAIDKSVTEGSAGGINLTKEELANIQKMGESALAGLNEDLLNLMETLGYKEKGKKAELSALQQGIQAMSEETAGELQALLNSIRWFVSQQTTDVTAIRTLLEARYGLESQEGEANPMLIELRAQTGYLEILSDRIDRVFAPTPNSKGPALRVIMQ